jgi:hypothetical protein
MKGRASELARLFVLFKVDPGCSSLRDVDAPAFWHGQRLPPPTYQRRVDSRASKVMVDVRSKALVSTRAAAFIAIETAVL